MTQTLSATQVRAMRLRAQQLLPGPSVGTAPPATVVAHLGGIQAQEADAALLAVGIRTPPLTGAQVESARVADRSLVRTWAFRGTLHLLATTDLAWLLPLLGPRFIRRSRRRYAELGLTDEQYQAGREVLVALLSASGPLTRSDVDERLAEQGVRFEGQALYHFLRRAGLEGLICFGPDEAGEQTYVLMEKWLPPGPSLPPEEAVIRLAHRYLAGYGPAQAEDLATWSGLPLRQMRDAFKRLAPKLLPVTVEGARAWLLPEQEAWLAQPPVTRESVHLLPAYDPYLLGYRRRDLIISPEYARRLHPGGGVIRPALVVAGEVEGTWRLKRAKDGVEIIVEPFRPLAPEVVTALGAAVDLLGTFYGTSATLTLAPAVESKERR